MASYFEGIQPARLRALAALLLWQTAAHVGAAEVAIPGTSVSLEAPAGYTVASTFSGLENLEDGSSITIAELPAEAYASISALFLAPETGRDQLAAQGMTIERSTTYTAAGQQVPVMIGFQQFAGGEIGKYMAVFRGERTVMLTFNVFDPEALTLDAVEAVIESVKLEPALALEDRLAQLRFSFTSVPPFRADEVILGSSVTLPSFEGTDPGGRKPLVMITRSAGPVPVDTDLRQLSRQILFASRNLAVSEIGVTEDVTFAGGPGVYMEAVAGARKVVQFLRVPDDGMAISLIATGAPAELDPLLPAVREIARSVTLRN